MNDNLPPLPPYAPEFKPRWPTDPGGYNEEQMQAYAREAIERQSAAAQPLTKTQRADVCVKAEAAMQRDPNLSWRDALMNETEKAHGITKGTT